MDKSLMNLGDFSKPVDTLINKIALAFGGYFKPYQMKRLAKAEVEAEQIRAAGEIETSTIKLRALNRFVAEEVIKQSNIEEITRKSFPHLDESSNPDEMDNDWIANFFDKCRIVSDEEMQNLWSLILAGEANSPGTFSKRTVNTMSSLDKSDALLFTSLCGFIWEIDGIKLPLIYDALASIYTDNDLNYYNLNHLNSIGLINFAFPNGHSLKLPKRVATTYFDNKVTLELAKEKGNI